MMGMILSFGVSHSYHIHDENIAKIHPCSLADTMISFEEYL